ncbi:SWF/SNF family helicase [hydrothermal vent metagenome]|uniref:SWF/SNF family helicase n=1 Tax=hydrothermal vent metagenome TaxID=652676 RepID=A0A3B1DCH5_9ZZZZ
MTTTAKSAKLTLSDLLSRLSFLRACKLLGEEGKRLIQQGGSWAISIDDQVSFAKTVFRVTFPDCRFNNHTPVVTIRQNAASDQQIDWNCSACDTACEHAGAAFSLILEEKMLLGLAEPPPERTPVESLGEEELVTLALEERQKRATTEKMKLRSSDPEKPWVDYTLTSLLSGKTYRVALRGEERGQSYCSCPDFRTNRLGTCKHIMNALAKVHKKFSAKKRNKKLKRKETSLHLEYGEELSLKLETPDKLTPDVNGVIGPIQNVPIADVHDLIQRITKLEQIGHEVIIYPDAEEYVQKQLFQDRIESLVKKIRKDPANHPLRNNLLNAELLPYQMDGIAFAVGAGRAILADDMGLGKTIQGIGVAEMLAQEADIKKVLVISPASLKSQWRNEIDKFCGRSCQIILGKSDIRQSQYQSDAFFTICNYEQVLRDHSSIAQTQWDLIILDEGQRIKNWEAKTSGLIKSLKSTYALVLTGTPLENRLDDLFSIVQFIDDRRLDPAYRFFNRHRVVDEKGKVLGYKNLDELRENLKPILLRRTRRSVMKDLPPRTNEIIRIPPTEEQAATHYSHMQIINTIVNKKFISEMDLLRLQKALLMCRMVANGTYLVTKQEPNLSSKLDELDLLLQQLYAEKDRKIILFSEWTTMLTLIEKKLEKQNQAGSYVRLDGSVPQKKRQQLVQEFQTNPHCRLFMMTNAGSTGLNLQAANTVINVDLPWNPAVLEQRIGRAHRMGQKNPVHVYILVTEETIEERLLATLSAKHELAMAALDIDSDVNKVDMVSGMQELKNRLEILLGAVPEAPVDVSLKAKRETELKTIAKREQISQAGGELLGAAFNFIGEMLPEGTENAASQQLENQLKQQFEECIERDDAGKPKLSVTLPSESALDNLINALAKMMTNK